MTGALPPSSPCTGTHLACLPETSVQEASQLPRSARAVARAVEVTLGREQGRRGSGRGPRRLPVLGLLALQMPTERCGCLALPPSVRSLPGGHEGRPHAAGTPVKETAVQRVDQAGRTSGPGNWEVLLSGRCSPGGLHPDAGTPSPAYLPGHTCHCVPSTSMRLAGSAVVAKEGCRPSGALAGGHAEQDAT